METTRTRDKLQVINGGLSEKKEKAGLSIEQETSQELSDLRDNCAQLHEDAAGLEAVDFQSDLLREPKKKLLEYLGGPLGTVLLASSAGNVGRKIFQGEDPTAQLEFTAVVVALIGAKVAYDKIREKYFASK